MLETVRDVQPLREWAGDFTARRVVETGSEVLIPWFDPADAGVRARMLLLLEAPGPMTNSGNKRPGSGFISVDNDDPTAANVWTTRSEFGITDHVLAWNIVPWYLGPASVKPKAHEVESGAAALLEVLTLLPDLQVVVVSGRVAQRGWDRHVATVRPDLHVIKTWHPSPLALAQRGKRDQFRDAFAAAAVQLGRSSHGSS